MKRESEIKDINIEEIIPNRFQPRLSFEPEALQELSESIKQYGVFQPLVVRRVGNKYEIIAGERRYKAATQAGFKEVPCVVIEVDDNESAEVALVENLQRRDLTPIEEAKSYKKLLDKGYLTQDQLAKKMGKSQSAVANKLRLLNLDEEVQKALLDSKISERHARSLLSIKDQAMQTRLLNKIITNRMTVRETDMEVKKMNEEINKPKDFIPVGQPQIAPINIETTQDISASAISLDELSKVDQTVVEEKPKTIVEEETVEEEIPMVDINKLTSSAADINKKEPRPDIMDLLKVEESGMSTFKAQAPNELYQTAPAQESAPIPTIMENPIPTPATPIIIEPVPTVVEEISPSPVEQNYNPFPPISAPQPEITPPVQTEIPLINETVPQTYIYENPQQPIPYEAEEPVAQPTLPATNMNVTNNLRTAINTARECVATIEKFGVTVDKEELDLADYYQITIKIEKTAA